MKKHTVKDEDGKNIPYMIRNEGDESNIESGLPLFNIDLSELDWKEVEVTLHNLLVKKEIYTLADLKRNRSAFNRILADSLSASVINVYVKHSEVTNG